MARSRLCCLVLVLAAASTAAAWSSDAADPLDVLVTPDVAEAPATTRIVATVERHPDNRVLVFEAESPAFFRSSRVALDGDHAARKHTMLLTALPIGVYTVTVNVESDTGVRATESRTLTVVGRASGQLSDPF